MSDEKVIWARKPFPPDVWRDSIFLAGPTPRSPDVPSWRPYAIRLLRNLGHRGYIIVPEDENGPMGEQEFDYEEQITWEYVGLEAATVVAFWIPRKLPEMPGFTTNVEFGMLVDSGRIVLGYPEDAEKMKYLHAHAESCEVPVSHDLVLTLKNAIELKHSIQALNSE